jgi:hypothetical protein
MRYRKIFGYGARLGLLLALAMAAGPARAQNQTPANVPPLSAHRASPPSDADGSGRREATEEVRRPQVGRERQETQARIDRLNGQLEQTLNECDAAREHIRAAKTKDTRYDEAVEFEARCRRQVSLIQAEIDRLKRMMDPSN